MSLQDELDAVRADFVRTARHQRRRRLGTAAARDLRDSHLIARSRLQRLNWTTANGWSRKRSSRRSVRCAPA